MIDYVTAPAHRDTVRGALEELDDARAELASTTAALERCASAIADAKARTTAARDQLSNLRARPADRLDALLGGQRAASIEREDQKRAEQAVVLEARIAQLLADEALLEE